MKKTFTLLCSGVGSLLLLSGAVSFSSCTKKEIITKDTTIIQYRDTTINITNDTTIDNQTYVVLNMGGWEATETTPVYISETPSFNKSNYKGVDSIVFVADPCLFIGTSGTCYMELYDATDQKVIGGSQISGSLLYNSANPGNLSTAIPYVSSANIADSLPAYPIDLYISIHMSEANIMGEFISAYLILYRK